MLLVSEQQQNAPQPSKPPLAISYMQIDKELSINEHFNMLLKL